MRSFEYVVASHVSKEQTKKRSCVEYRRHRHCTIVQVSPAAAAADKLCGKIVADIECGNVD